MELLFMKRSLKSRRDTANCVMCTSLIIWAKELEHQNIKLMKINIHVLVNTSETL